VESNEGDKRDDNYVSKFETKFRDEESKKRSDNIQNNCQLYKN
jgi:hypothetical protein